MIWEDLKNVLKCQEHKATVSRLLNIAKQWGTFGIGSGGQMNQYLIAKILQLQGHSKLYYFSCGKWWPSYKDQFPDITGEADIIKIQLTEEMSEDTPPQSMLQSNFIFRVVIKNLFNKVCYLSDFYHLLSYSL